MAIAPNNRLARHLVWSLAFAASLARGDQDFAFAADVGVGHTDNIFRTAENERSENLASLGAQMSLRERTRRISADLLADLSYVHYPADTYDNEVNGNFIGSAKFAVMPEHVSWVFEDNFGQSVTDPLATVTPNNQENVNVIATGPDFFLPLGPVNRAGLSARYMQTDFEDSDFGSERYSALLYFGRDLSSTAVLSLRASDEKITPRDESVSAKYDISELYARYEIAGSQTTLSVEGGATRFERGEFSDTGPLLRMTVSRELTARSTLRATLGREFSDVGRALRFEQGFAGINTATAAVASSPEAFEAQHAALGWGAVGRRARLDLSASYTSEDYLQGATFDRTRLQFAGRLDWDFGPRLTGNLSGNHADNRVDTVGGDSVEDTIGAGLSWRAGRAIYMDLRYEHTRRTADSPDFEFAEQRAWLRLRYGAEPVQRVPSIRNSAD